MNLQGAHGGENSWIPPATAAIQRQRRFPERRRPSRQQGQLLLFAAAQDIARLEGRLAEGVHASLEHSVIGRSGYALKTRGGQVIDRIPLSWVREMLRFRQRVARRTVGDASVNVAGVVNVLDLRQRLRLRSDEERSLVWAISHGRRFPYVGSMPRHDLIALGLLILGVLPGVAYLVRLSKRYADYRKHLYDLVTSWRSLGKQVPDPSFFSLYGLIT